MRRAYTQLKSIDQKRRRQGDTASELKLPLAIQIIRISVPKTYLVIYVFLLLFHSLFFFLLVMFIYLFLYINFICIFIYLFYIK